MAWDRSRRRKIDASPWQLEGDSINSSRREASRRDNVTRPATAPSQMLLSRSATSTSISTTSQLPLSVRLTITFTDPVARDKTHIREYECSPDFQATDKICRGLLHRIGYCSEELITRKDTSALESRGRDGRQSQLRYEISYHIFRRGSLWAERTFRSYQKQALIPEHASTILLASHKIVGLFLRYHDDAFRWTDEPKSLTHETYNERPTTPNPKIGTPLPLSCVPSPRFDESTQTYDSHPGFSIELRFNSRSRARKHCDWTRALRLNSAQESPLNLALAEELYWRVSKAVTGALDAKKETFFSEHAKCEFLEGMVSCQHFGEDALEVEFAVTNHLGPAFDHLRQRLRTRLGLFRHPDGLDCQDFLRRVHEQLIEARDRADTSIARTADFDFTILELRGRGWSTSNVARVSLDSTGTYSRRSTQAIMDRLQAGVADVLRGHDVEVHYAATKRGHLVLDKAVIARADKSKKRESFRTPEEEKDAFVARLRFRIDRDLERITKDTFSVDGLSEDDEEISAWNITTLSEDSTDQIVDDEMMVDSSSPESSQILDLASLTSQSRPRVFPLIPQRYSSRGSSDISWASADMGTPRPQTAPLAALVLDDSRDSEKPDSPERTEPPSSPLSQAVSPKEDSAVDLTGSTATEVVVQASNDDETSSQLSTPGLTNGTGSSPRNSLLITPTLLRTQSGTEIGAYAEPRLVADDLGNRELGDSDIAEPVDSVSSDSLTTIGAGKVPAFVEVASQLRPRTTSSCPSDDVSDLRGDTGANGCEGAYLTQQPESHIPITEADAKFEDFSRSKPDLEFEADEETDSDSGPDALHSVAEDVSKLQIDALSAPHLPPEDDFSAAQQLQSDLSVENSTNLGPVEVIPVTECIENDHSVVCGHDEVTEDVEPAAIEFAEFEMPDAAAGTATELNGEALIEDRSADEQLESHARVQPAESHPDGSHSRVSSRSVSGSTIVELPDPAEVVLSDTTEILNSGDPLAAEAVLRLTEGEPSSAWQDYDSDCGTECAEDDSLQAQVTATEPTAPIKPTIDHDADDDLPDDPPDEESVRPSGPGRRHTLPALGMLGFQETKVFEMGLRGALVGSRRFDVPVPVLSPALDSKILEPEATVTETRKSIDRAMTSGPELSGPHRPAPLRRRAKSSAGSKLLSPSSPRSQRPAHRHRRSLSSSKIITGEKTLRNKRSGLGRVSVQPAQPEQDVMLPRVVLMFASMAIVSQMVNNAG